MPVSSGVRPSRASPQRAEYSHSQSDQDDRARFRNKGTLKTISFAGLRTEREVGQDLAAGVHKIQENLKVHDCEHIVREWVERPTNAPIEASSEGDRHTFGERDLED